MYQWQQKSKQEGQTCGTCGRVRDNMTVDHIVPMSFLEMVGLKIEAGYVTRIISNFYAGPAIHSKATVSISPMQMKARSMKA